MTYPTFEKVARVATCLLGFGLVVSCAKGLLPIASSTATGSLSISSNGVYNFGGVLAKQQSINTFTLTNVGGAPVSLSRHGVPGNRAETFAFLGGSFPGTGGTCGATLAAGAACTATTVFTPPRSGSFSGSLGIAGAALSLSGDGLGGGVDVDYGTGGATFLTSGALSSFGFAKIQIAFDSNGRAYLSDSVGAVNPVTAIARFLTDGTLDTTFGTGGQTTVDVSSVTFGLIEYAESSLAQPDGKLVVAGRRNLNTMFVFRITTGGSLDTTFATGGIMTNAATDSDWPSKVVLSSDGKLLVWGERGAQPSLIRLTSAGAFDATFDGDGILLPSLGSVVDTQDLELDASGRLVVTGSRSDGGGGIEGFVARFLSDGTPDTSFDSDGVLAVNLSNYEMLHGLQIAPSGELVVVGYTSLASPARALALRLNTDGSFDTTFDSDGYAVIAGSTAAGVSNNVALQTDGKIVATASSIAFRLNTDGSLDTTFGTSGVYTIIGSLPVAFMGKGALDSQDRFVFSAYNASLQAGVFRVMP